MAFELPTLKYPYDALEPHIDARTMEIHHSKHHNGYTNKLNAAIEGTDLAKLSIEQLLAKWIEKYKVLKTFCNILLIKSKSDILKLKV